MTNVDAAELEPTVISMAFPSSEAGSALFDQNDTSTDYSFDTCVHTLIEEQTVRSPDAVAVVCEHQQLTYQELNLRANRLARFLRSRGVGPDVPVGLCAERSPEMVVALLGILKAGGAYVPLDPEHPPDRLNSIAQDCSFPVILTQAHLADRLSTLSFPTFFLDRDWFGLSQFDDSEFEPLASPSDLAYIIYTSGSTGLPKGAMNSHRGICNRLLWMQDTYRLTSVDRVLQKTPFSFDVSVWEFFCPLLAGSQLILARPGGHRDPAYLASLIQDAGITVIHFVPSMLDVFLDEPALEKSCRTLCHVFTSGETLPEAVARRCLQRLPARLHNLYGPTEAAVEATFRECRLDDPAGPVPIGRPIANMRTYVLDEQLRPLPVGVSGELFLGGVGVARGYLNRPELTAEKFLDDPFCDEPDAQMYRTGDLVRWRPDGELDFLGRLDHQVKLRGYRIELGEIETALAGHSEIRQAAVLLREDRPGDKRLVAYFVLANPPIAPSNFVLREFLEQSLPKYMVPSAFVTLESLPVTSNGKLDRKSLPAPEMNRLESTQAYVAPQTSLERQLAEIWFNVLGIERIGSHDNFFELGGNSLMATRLTWYVRSVLEFELTIRSVFEHPTIAGLAKFIEATRCSANTLSVDLPLRRALRTGRLQLSFAQERLWFLDRYEPQRTIYNVPLAWRLCGPLNSAVLERCLQELIDRHEPLRTTFRSQDGERWQVVDEAAAFQLQSIDLRNRLATERQAHAMSLATEESNRPFELASDLMLRGQLIQLADEEHWLVLVLHHIASDGWSIEVLERELTALYESFSVGRPSPLTKLPLQYADYAAWQRQWLSGDILEKQLAYWKRQLAGAPVFLELPTDHPRPSIQGFRGERQQFLLDQTLAQSLLELGRRENLTLFMTLLAGWQVLLSRYSGQTDIVVGAPIAGRQRPELENLIGFFVNTLALRMNVAPNQTVREYLQHVREVTLSAYTHQDIPFEKLVQELRPQRSTNHSPVFQVMFVLQNPAEISPEIPHLSLSRLDVGTNTAKYDLTLSLVETGEGLRADLDYDADLFDASTIERMIQHYRTVLEGIVCNLDLPVDHLPLLTATERRQILVEWNNATTEYSSEKCLHELFEEQVDRTPDAVAVAFEDQQLTYRELDSRSNRIACFLRDNQIGPGVPVGLCAERSLEMVIAILGILKAGGGYVPLDPDLPNERLNAVIRDASFTIVLVQEHLLERFPDLSCPAFCLDRDWSKLECFSNARIPNASSPSDLAYIIYTSGSTGVPKGVMNSHRGICNSLLSGQSTNCLTPRDRVLQKAPFSFDASVLEIFSPLLFGSQLIMARPGGHRDSNYLKTLIRERKITWIFFVPSMLEVFLEETAIEECCASLRHLMVGGEALTETLARHCLERIPARLFNCYGPTEAAIFATSREYRREDLSGPVTIGRPIPNMRAYILDAQRQPSAIGIPGELFLSGVGVASGYLNRPELTEEKFLDDPFCDRSGTKMYRTGDLVRWRSDGEIEFLGRLDHQVKLRGFRIELGEIETMLGQHPGICQSVVLLREDRRGDKRLVAYVVAANPSAAPSVKELRGFLEPRLPEYMIPSAFVTLESLPLTPNEKLDRNGLPAPEFDRLVEAVSYVAPQTPLEQILAEAWSNMLGIERIGIHDNFFELGGHSLLAIGMLDLVNRRIAQEIKVSDLFLHPTIGGLAKLFMKSEMNRNEKIENRTYLESIREGKGPTTIVCVGTHSAEFMEALPHDVPVWWLKLDGLHVCPHLNLDIPSQAARHAEEILEAIPSGNLLLLGFSFGGLLSFEIAQILDSVSGRHAQLVLLEPPPPGYGETMMDRICRHRLAMQDLTISKRVTYVLSCLRDTILGRFQKTRARLQQTLQGHSSEEQKWHYMAPFISQQISAYRPKKKLPADITIHVIGRPDYFKNYGYKWQDLVFGTISNDTMSDDLTHLDVVLPRNSAAWVTPIRELIAKNATGIGNS